MYAKLFSRIAQSSLMEEKVNTRYVFMMMLALSDRHGEVIGTDVAISRMMNVPKNDFCDALKPLLEPDLDSNSPAEEGRRIILSENGRGYKIVNYLNYRDIKSDDEKREYMRQYMKRRRDKTKENDENVNSVNPCKVLLNDVTHTEAEAEVDTKKNKKPSYDDTFDFCNKIGLTRTDAEYMQDKWLETGFKNNGKPIKDWQAQIRNWKRMSYLPSTKQKPAMRSTNEPSQLRSFP
tara:strand:- start:395 stop:1099 length:705 start_codon:yes stop_codon:yes gene_type:complete